jgi:hypothetical protein
MTTIFTHNQPCKPVQLLIVDMSDCYTWSFPEFLPFCKQLYFFSTYKDFKRNSLAA